MSPARSVRHAPLRVAVLLGAQLAIVGCGGEPSGHVAGGEPRGYTAGGEPSGRADAGEAPAPALDLEGVGHVSGDSIAPVTVVEFTDFACSYCGEFARDVQSSLHREFVETGRVRWRVVPFVVGAYPNAMEAAIAAECAAGAGEEAFRAMHDRLFARQREWLRRRDPLDRFIAYAAEIGLDAAGFEACYRAGAVRDRIRKNNRLSLLLGVRATPTFFVDGRPVEGALPLGTFRALLAGE